MCAVVVVGIVVYLLRSLVHLHINAHTHRGAYTLLSANT